MSTAIIEGACACNSVNWKSTIQPKNLIFCYCTQCQQITGSAFGAWMGILEHAVTFSGPVTMCQLSDVAMRSFCQKCGGTLTMQYHCYPQMIYLTAGTVVKGTEVVPKLVCHMFVGDKPSWYKIPEDGVRRWEGFDDDFVKIVDRWRAGRGKY